MKHFLFGVMKIVSQAMMWSLSEKKILAFIAFQDVQT